MSFKNWLGQSTTGAGFAALFGTLGGVASGSITLEHAAPVLVGAAIGLIWPENTRLRLAVEDTVQQAEVLATAYKAALLEAQGTRKSACQSITSSGAFLEVTK